MDPLVLKRDASSPYQRNFLGRIAGQIACRQVLCPVQSTDAKGPEAVPIPVEVTGMASNFSWTGVSIEKPEISVDIRSVVNA